MRHENNEKLTELLCRWKTQCPRQTEDRPGLWACMPHAIPVIISVNNHITMPRQPPSGSRESGVGSRHSQWQSNPKLSKLSLSSDHRNPCQEELQPTCCCASNNTCPPPATPPFSPPPLLLTYAKQLDDSHHDPRRFRYI